MTRRPPPFPPVRTDRTTVLRIWAWRLRVPLAAAAVAVVAVQVAAATHGPKTVRIVATSRTVPAGTVLTSDDLRYVQMPTGLVPSAASTAVADLVGQHAAVDLARGTPVVGGLTVDVPHGPRGTVVATVRLDDPSAASVARPGSQVDVLATALDSVEARRIVRRGLVLPGPDAGTDPDAPRCGEQDGVLVLAVTPQEAQDLAATTGQVLSVYLVG
jgi:Flp pilus assembly protein CpaB